MKTLSITMQINGKTVGIFPDPSFKEKSDLVAMARAIAKETWYNIDLIACVQLSDDPLDIEWRTCQFDKNGEVRKLWLEKQEGDEE